jgi:uncharacterized protein
MGLWQVGADGSNSHYKWRLIHTDPDDDKFVDCVIVSNATYIITNDGHFGISRKLPP